MIDKSALRRRALVTGGAGAVAVLGFAGAGTAARAQGVKPLPGYVGWKDADAMIVHSDQTIETRRSHFDAALVMPDDKLYIRNNIKPPPDSIVADRNAWRVEFAGVGQPRTLAVGELKRMGLTTVATVLQCSGNGRKYFQDRLAAGQRISGTPWTVGAAGCVIWTGVPLRAVIETLGGAVAGARFITGTGGEELPAGLNPKDVIVERSVPIATLDDVVLAWEMNGAPIPLAHGGPLRMIVPGYSGVNNVKYVRAVALTAAETDAKIQTTSYRIHALGERPSPEDPSVWEQPVKSWITSPLEGGVAGRAQVTGVAFGSMCAATGVEVSTDGGRSWAAARFIGPDLGPFAWRTFVLPVELAAGRHLLVSRATDARGNVQPEEAEMNGSGYNHNGWRAPGVEITVS